MVPGHGGIAGNEADQTADGAADWTCIDIQVHCQDLKPTVSSGKKKKEKKKWIEEAYNSTWYNQEQADQLREDADSEYVWHELPLPCRWPAT